MPTTYPPLAIGARRRLAMFRTEAARPGWVRPMTWRDVRFATLKSHEGLSPGSNDPGVPAWYTQGGPAFERERFAEEVSPRRIDHKGWFTDTDGGETARGIVAALPHGRYLAGYLWTDNDERVYFPTLYTDEDDAASAADRHANRFADGARDDSERFDRMQDAETACTDAAESLRDAWALRRSGRRTSDDVREAVQALRDARAELAESTAAYERS